MGYRSAADGITKQGRTKGKNLGDTGSHDGIQVGKKPAKGIAGGKTNDDMKALGRGLARAKADGK
jgi:hypothetical protein